MAQPQGTATVQLQRRLLSVLTGPPALAFLPAMTLAAYWMGGEVALMVAATLLPAIYLAGGGFPAAASAPVHSGLVLSKAELADQVDYVFHEAKSQDRSAAFFCLVLDDFEQLSERYGQAAADTVVKQTGERLLAMLREGDTVGQLGDARFAICTRTVRNLDLETCIQMCARMQGAVEEPISIDGLTVYVSASIGFCQNTRAPGRSSADWMQAASTALRVAQRRGPSAIRAFSDQMRRESESRNQLRDEVARALEDGQIQPWFQPQISTDTGKISGFEALARWQHPKRGMISPGDFLPAVEEAGLLERLAEVMMYHSFVALKAWEKSGVRVPQVGVNFAGSELSNPRLIDKIQWELDRFDLTPDRLAVEVLETVVASAPDDVITRNIIALGEMGCRIDLDDFGTGHASITSIRRFSVSRIKIDRSFVMKADRDQDQQRMIGAILTMAERLGVETLAEGVETVGEHVLLSQLGCDHVQGFGIGRPMPFADTLDWISRHEAKLANMPRIVGGSGA